MPLGALCGDVPDRLDGGKMRLVKTKRAQRLPGLKCARLCYGSEMSFSREAQPGRITGCFARLGRPYTAALP